MTNPDSRAAARQTLIDVLTPITIRMDNGSPTPIGPEHAGRIVDALQGFLDTFSFQVGAAEHPITLTGTAPEIEKLVEDLRHG